MYIDRRTIVFFLGLLLDYTFTVSEATAGTDIMDSCHADYHLLIDLLALSKDTSILHFKFRT